MADKDNYLTDWEKHRSRIFSLAADKYKNRFPGPPPETPEEEAKRLGREGLLYKKFGAHYKKLSERHN